MYAAVSTGWIRWVGGCGGVGRVQRRRDGDSGERDGGIVGYDGRHVDGAGDDDDAEHDDDVDE